MTRYLVCVMALQCAWLADSSTMLTPGLVQLVLFMHAGCSVVW
jgi:hypothetical protein